MHLLRNLVGLLLALLLVTPWLVQSTTHATSSPQAVPAGWNITTIDDGDNLDVGRRASIAISPLNNKPYISYYNATNKDLRLATYLGTPTNGTCSYAWTCVTVDATGSSGEFSSLAFEGNNSGNYGLAYTEPESASVIFRRYNSTNQQQSVEDVATDGTIVNTPEQVLFSSLAFNGSFPVLAYYTFDGTSDDDYYQSSLVYDEPDGSSTFNYDEIEYAQHDDATKRTVGYYPSIDIGPNGLPRIAFRGLGNGRLKIAEFVPGSPGSGCDVAQGKQPGWNCSVVDPTPLTGYHISHHAPDCQGDGCTDRTQIAYYDDTNKQIKYAKYVGGNVNCGSGGTQGWQCQVIEFIGSDGNIGDIGVSLVVRGDQRIIAYTDKNDMGNNVLKIARHVGFGGNCGVGELVNEWQCEIIDDGGANHDDVGQYLSAALDKDGKVYVAYYNATDGALMLAHEKSDAVPGFSKSYTPSIINQGEKTLMKFSIKNNLPHVLSGVTFTNNLIDNTIDPATVQSNCGGTVSILINNHAIKLTDGVVLGNGACTITAQVTGEKAGTSYWSTSPLKSNEANDAPATNSQLTVNAPPTVTPVPPTPGAPTATTVVGEATATPTTPTSNEPTATPTTNPVGPSATSIGQPGGQNRIYLPVVLR